MEIQTVRNLHNLNTSKIPKFLRYWTVKVITAQIPIYIKYNEVKVMYNRHIKNE